MTLLRLQIDNLVDHFRARRSEWLLSFTALGLGLAYLGQPGLFDYPTFAAMRIIGAQTTWGSVVAGVAGMRLVMLYINGSWRISPYFRAGGAYLCSGLWFILFFAQSFSAVPPQTRWVWLAFLVFDMLNAGDAAFDAGAVSSRREAGGA